MLLVPTAGGQRTFFLSNLQSLRIPMAQGHLVCRQARRHPGCSNGLRGPTKVAGLSACSGMPLANAIPPKFQHPRVGAHCQGLGPAIEVLASQCQSEDIIVQLHAAEPLCRQHFSHCSLHLFLRVLADCFPHALEGQVVEVLRVIATSMHTCVQWLFSCVQQSCM